MRYASIGYSLLVLSPMLSLVLLMGTGLPSEVNVLVVGVQISGMILYVTGYKRSGNSYETSSHVLVSGVLLTVWGFLVAWYLVTMYSFHITHYLPEKPLTFWDNVEIAVYVLKGVLWIVSGLMLIITRISKMLRLHQTSGSNLK